MKRILTILLACCIMLSPMMASAETITEEDVSKELAKTVKYYKTVTVQELTGLKNYTEEISKEEYEKDDVYAAHPYGSGYVETTYKKMTTTIVESGSVYRYKVVLDWKLAPKVRSFDVIAIGFPPSVRADSVFFEQSYCVPNGGCHTSYIHTPQIFERGVGASFQLPSGSLESLQQTLYFNVLKNVDATILTLYAYGDYAHATSTVTHAKSKKYSVNIDGITFDSSVLNSYDEIDTSDATLTGLNW